MKPRILRTLLALSALVVTLCLCELAMRVFLPGEFVPSVERDTALGWRGRANLSCVYRHALFNLVFPIELNDAGFRDRDRTVAKPAGTTRTLCLGDSYTWGWGLDADVAYPRRLEDLLAARGLRAEVINTGVPGYNTYMKVESLRARSVAFGPDVVIMQHTINDLLLPEFVYEYPDVLSLKRSFALDFALGRYKLADNKLKVVFEADFKEVPQRFKYMEGEEGFARAMVSLRDLRREHGFEVVVHISHDHPMGIAHGLMALCKEMEFHCFIKLHRTDDPKLIVSKKDLHPSELGHNLLAEHFFKFLETEGLIDKAIAR